MQSAGELVEGVGHPGNLIVALGWNLETKISLGHLVKPFRRRAKWTQDGKDKPNQYARGYRNGGQKHQPVEKINLP